MKLTTPPDNTIIYYGLTNETNRGRVTIQSLNTYSTPFYVFTSGTHDVGNRPYTYTSNLKNSRNRSVHNGYQQIGTVTDAISFSISDSSYVLIRGELCCTMTTNGYICLAANPQILHVLGGEVREW